MVHISNKIWYTICLTNTVVEDDCLYYIDYECNDYMEEWNFENWGIKYWSKTEEFLKYVEEHR